LSHFCLDDILSHFAFDKAARPISNGHSLNDSDIESGPGQRMAGFVNSNAPDQLWWHCRLANGECFMDVGVSKRSLFTAGFLTGFADQTLDIGTSLASSSQCQGLEFGVQIRAATER
jgi:hypothetical protein